MGVVGLVVCAGMTVAHTALLVRAVWASRLCRVVAIILLFGFVAALIIGLVNVLTAEETGLPASTMMDRVLDVILSTPVLLPSIGIVVVGAILRLLMGKTSQRYFGIQP